MNIKIRVFVLLFVASLVACSNPGEIKLKSQNSEKTDEFYEFSYVLSDGQSRIEKGEKKKVGAAETYEVVGSYAFELDGKKYLVEYTSGVDGYKAIYKETISKPPPIVLQISPNVIKTLTG